MAQSIPFPKDDLWLELPIWQDLFLEASNETAIWHEANLLLKSRQRRLRDRKDDLVVSPCRSLRHLKATLHVTSQALPASIDLVVDDEN